MTNQLPPLSSSALSTAPPTRTRPEQNKPAHSEKAKVTPNSQQRAVTDAFSPPQPTPSSPKNPKSLSFPDIKTQTVSQPKGETMGVAKGTGYYPHDSELEGGHVDKKGKDLNTLQDFLEGKSDYVSVALDKNLYKSGKIEYGDTFRIPELEAKYGKEIVFKAVDTGGAFTDKAFSRIDVCTRSKEHSEEPTVNGKLTLIKTP